jgi:hypothetical protein
VPDPSRAILRVEPHTIPHLRDLLTECLNLLSEKLNDLNGGGRMVDAWMHDPVSLRMRDVYNASVMDASDGGYAALRAYEYQLKGVYEELGRLEAEYRRTEEANEALFEPRA